MHVPHLRHLQCALRESLSRPHSVRASTIRSPRTVRPGAGSVMKNVTTLSRPLDHSCAMPDPYTSRTEDPVRQGLVTVR